MAVRRTRISDRLVLITETLPDIRSATLGFWINRGSRTETAKRQGVSHLYEHMVFKGTRRRSAYDIARCLERSGGMLNAFTGKEQICFHAKVVDEAVGTACDLIRDLYDNPLFDAGDLEKEKSVIQEEIRSAEDNPEECVYENLIECIWPGQGLGYPIAGNARTVSDLDRSALLRFRSGLKRAPLIIAASGNISHGSLKKYFADLPQKPPNRAPVLKPAVFGRERRRFVRKNILQTNIALAFRACPFNSPDRYPFLVFNALLGDGMSSSLFQRIREHLGLAYSVYSFMEVFFDTGLLVVYLGTDTEKAALAVTEVLREVKRLLNGGISPETLEFAKSYIRGNVLLGMENTAHRMNQLARSEIYHGRAQPVFRALKHIDRVTLADLRRIGRNYFTDSQMYLSVVGPKRGLPEPSLRKLNFDRIG